MSTHTENGDFLKNINRMVIALSTALPAYSSLAQSTEVQPASAAQAATDNSSSTLQTVTVTAQRTPELIEDVPMSVTQITQDKIDTIDAGGMDIRALSGEAPSLNIESSNGRTFPRFYIRGYGNTDYTTFASQPVSLVYDDVVQENPALKGFPMFDMQDVEVLAGPQGTLFGRNTPAGVVKFDSNKPRLNDSSGYYSISDGTYNSATAEAAMNIPMGNEWAMRISTLVDHRDDWVTNVGGGTPNLGGYDDRSVRVQLLYQPSNNFNALFNVHARDSEGGVQIFRANTIGPGTNELNSNFNVSQADLNGLVEAELHTVGGSARLTWNLSDYKISSITGVETISHYVSLGDVDGGTTTGPGFIPFQVQSSSGVTGLTQFTQEIRIESKYDSPLNWQAGYYYFHENVGGQSSNYYPYNSYDLSSYIANQQTNTANALFGSLSYDATDQLKLAAGARYTQDKKNFWTTDDYNVSFVGPGAVAESKSNVTWDTSATYAANSDINLYARIATGFRAASVAAPTAYVPITVAQPETIISYEAGVKADLLDGRERIGFSVFDYDISNQQLTVAGGANDSSVLTNASKTVGHGAELNFEANLTKHLHMTLGGSYNFTEIKDPTLLVASCAACIMLSPEVKPGLYSINGDPLPQAPKWIANATLRYGVPFENNSEWYVLGDVSYRSEVNFVLYRSVEYTGPGLPLLGLRSGYKWQDDKYEVSAYVRNLANKVVPIGGIDFNNLTSMVNDPRIIGVEFRARF